MAKYIDSEKLIAEIKRRLERYDPNYTSAGLELKELISFVTSLQKEPQMPDSTRLIAEWEKEKAMLEQKDFRGDAERTAYNAFLDGFVKGLGYECTK